MNALVPIDSKTLEAVTGGRSNIDSLLGQLNSITGSISEIKNKTNGLGSNEMLLLCMLAFQNRGSNAVYVNRPGCWW
jgi:hypothetical protein